MEENFQKEINDAKKELINLYLLLKPRKIEEVKIYHILLKYIFYIVRKC